MFRPTIWPKISGLSWKMWWSPSFSRDPGTFSRNGWEWDCLLASVGILSGRYNVLGVLPASEKSKMCTIII